MSRPAHLLFLAASGLLLRAAPVPAQTLESVLRDMDTAAASFRSLSAHIRSVKHTAIVNDDTVDEGTIWVKRVKPRVSHLLIEFTVPDAYYVAVTEKKAEIYRPKVATVEEYDISRVREMKDQFWLLSFGAGGRDLASHYQVSYKGAESVAGQPAVKLELIPKSADLRKQIPRIEIWVSTTHSQPVRQKFYEVTPGDYRLSTYSDLKLNVAIPDARLRIKTAPGTKRIQPQK